MSEKRSSWKRVPQAVVTLVAVAMVVVLVPVALVVVVGVPLPHPLSLESVLTLRGFFDLIVAVVWCLWLIEVVAITRTTAGAVRRRGQSMSGPTSMAEVLGVRLAGAILVVSAAWSGAAIVAVVAGASSVPAVVATVTVPIATVPIPAVPTPAPPVTGDAPAVPSSVPSTVVVMPGDSLWSLAQQLYGDGADWQMLASANLGRVMANGTRFTTPDLILPTWELLAPRLESAPTTTPTPPVPVPLPPTPAATVPPTTVPSVTSSPATAHSAHHTASTKGSSHRAGEVTAATRKVDGRTVGGSGHAHHEPSPILPELVLLGIGGLSAAVLARRVRWQRVVSRIGRRFGQVTLPVSGIAEELEEDLGPFADSPAPGVLAAALAHLTHAVRSENIVVPRVRLVRLGPDGVALVLAEKTEVAPGMFELQGDGRAWVLPATVEFGELPGAREGEVWLPALVPLGEDETGSHLAPVEPGESLAVVGPEAEEAVAAMRSVARAWEWQECQLRVALDPIDAAIEAVIVERGPGAERIRVLYFGDPSELDTVTRTQVGVIGQDADAATDVVVVCEAGITRVEPFGLLLRPSGLDAEKTAAVDELLAAAAAEPMDSIEDPSVDESKMEGDMPSSAFPAPGPREARVLVAKPRIDGAGDEEANVGLPRAIELFCYLALHGGSVPRTELMTEALATGDGPAVDGTVRNVAARLRKLVGAEYVESAQGTGYRVSDAVTTDLGRLREAVRLAGRTEDEEERIALLVPTLELIEGRPVSHTTSGWGWWIVYESSAKDAACDAAAMLAPILAARGDRARARWVIDQARLVEDCSEALSRVAMQCGALVGDAGWVEREFRLLESRLSELWVGTTPSEETCEEYRSALRRIGVLA